MNIVAALRTPRAGAVEMPPRGKRGKLKEQVSHPSHRAWKSGKGQPDSHISTAPAAALFMRKEMRKDEEKTEFPLTDSITSSTIRMPASLRSENDQLHLGTSDRDHIGITNHLHRNKHLSNSIPVPVSRMMMRDIAPSAFSSTKTSTLRASASKLFQINSARA